MTSNWLNRVGSVIPRGFSRHYVLTSIREDISECHDLAEKYPEKLRRLVELWWAEAGKYNVLPLDDRLQERLIGARGGANLLSWYCKTTTAESTTYKKSFTPHYC
jgi:hypothetical protein